jgi:soluble lytic murein transglycosylase
MIFRWFVLAALLPLTALAKEDPFAEQRQLFKDAYALVERGQVEPARPDSEELRTYPLYPYLQAARIKRALAGAGDSLTAADERAMTFVAYYDREPIGRDLRLAWLANLAQRQQWSTFLDHYRDNLGDNALRCHSFTARIQLGRTEGLADDIAAQWLTPKSLPPCERAFDWLSEQGRLTPVLIEQRVKLALRENNASFARQIAAKLDPQRAAPLLQWAALIERPQANIDALIANPSRSVDPEAMLAGWRRLARSNRDAAIARFEKLVRSRKLSAEEASPLALALALPLSWDRRSAEALEYFQQVRPGDFDDTALEWQARAAMWSEDWPLVTRSIAAMSDANRKTARWRYWAARAAEHERNPKLARQLYESVIIDDNYYSAMAAARLGEPVAPHLEKLDLNEVELTQVSQLPAMVRARELLLLNMRPWAVAEWRYGVETLSETARRQAVHLAARWGWYDQAIATAAQQRIFNDYELLYPTPYDREVSAAAKLTGLQPELIYSVMRQESLFRADAVSSAGAVGLLQLLPETARRTARHWKRPTPTTTDLTKPSVNVPLGAGQLRMLMDRFEGQTFVALAGYNAGPNAAARWLPSQSMESDIWIENIPYNETRTYVQRIIWHSIVFNWLRTGEPQRADIWAVRVAPLGERPVVGMNEGAQRRAEGG